MKQFIRFFCFCLLMPLCPQANAAPKFSIAIEASLLTGKGPFVEYTLAPRHRVSGFYARQNGWHDEWLDVHAVQYTYMPGSGAHRAEFGFGGTWVRKNNYSFGSYQHRQSESVVLSVGYRFEPQAGGVQLRTGMTWRPVYSGLASILPWPYASVGWTF